MDPIALSVVALLAGGAAIKTGLFDRACDYLGIEGAKRISWLSSESGKYASLPDRLGYCDFYDDVVETRRGTLWAGLELTPVATDGLTDTDLNDLANKLNRCFTALPDNTWVQLFMRQDAVPIEGQAVFARAAESNREDPALWAVMKSRHHHLGREASQGLVLRRRFFVFIGRREKKLKQKLSIKGVVSSDPFLELERKQFERLREDVLRCAEQFANCYMSAGGRAALIPARVAFALAYEKLNPERSLVVPAPAYVTPTGTIYNSDPWFATAQNVSQLETKVNSKGRGGVTFDTIQEYTFANNPRETLCFTTVEVEDDYLLFGRRPVMTIHLQRLPVATCAGMMEILTRRRGITFPFEVCTSFEIVNQQKWDEKLERSWDRFAVSLLTAIKPDLVQKLKSGEIATAREQVRVGEEKIGLFGLGITFSAADVPELYRRRDLILSILRNMQGLEGASEMHTPFREWITTLPCQSDVDNSASSTYRRQPCMSHNAVGLTPLTGSATGCAPEQAKDVFQKADGGLYFFDHHSSAFNSGMSMYVGTAGSGKSALLNRQRVTLAAHGYIGATIDYGGSATRICELLGGRYIDIADPNRVAGLGLFNIYPQPGEHFEPEELTPEGIPNDRLTFVQTLLEMLCLDPTRPTELGLEAEYVSILRDHIQLTYAQLCGVVPTINDFIRTLSLATRAEKAIGQNLASRLKLFATEGSLGRFLNDASKPLTVDNPYTVFDFLGVRNDPRLMLIATMAVSAFVDRFVRQSRQIPKWLDVDEYYVVTEYPLLQRLINRTIRTARKQNAIISVASQDPADFTGEENKGIRSNCEVKWLFNMTNPRLAGQVFELSQGVVQLLEALPMNSGPGYRDCVLVCPPRQSVYLRIRNSALEQRLLQGAGRETATLQDVYKEMKATGCQMAPRVKRAIEMDGLGEQPVRRVPQASARAGQDQIAAQTR